MCFEYERESKQEEENEEKRQEMGWVRGGESGESTFSEIAELSQ